MIQNDPMHSRISQIMAPMLLFSFLSDVFVVLNDHFHNQSEIMLFIGLALFLITIAGMIILYIQASLRSRRLEDRRERAMHGDKSLLASEQPVPDDKALPIPFAIKNRLKLSPFLLATGVITIVYFSFFIGIAVGGRGQIADYSSFLAALSIPFLFVILILAIVFTLVWRFSTDQIYVTERGIGRGNTSEYAKYTIMRWDEMGVFTIIGSNKSGRVQWYELANSEKVLRLMRLPRGWLRASYKPTVPYDEYEQQMDALLNLIAAKTGLPLYDLRSSDPVRLMP